MASLTWTLLLPPFPFSEPLAVAPDNAGFSPYHVVSSLTTFAAPVTSVSSRHVT